MKNLVRQIVKNYSIGRQSIYQTRYCKFATLALREKTSKNGEKREVEEKEALKQGGISHGRISEDNPFSPVMDNSYYYDKQSGNYGSGYSDPKGATPVNSNLQQFFQLPRLTKEDADQIITEVSTDLESSWTPSKLVSTLDRHIISQSQAKKIIAQAIRNKYRMRKVEGELREFMRPSNILVHGKSGSGKTEIFRLIAKLYNAPFIRVEATRYTEVGYHGDDITNIIVDLYKKTQSELVNRDATEIFKNSKLLNQTIENHIMKLILGPKYQENPSYQEKLDDYRAGLLDEYYCLLYVPTDRKTENSLFSHLKVKDIRKFMFEVYTDELFAMIDMEEFVKSEVENKGIVVIDEIDKLVRSPDSTSTTKASDEGVQYDLLPILDGTTVNINQKIKINTRNILFVGAGAFEKVKPSDLAIELQGRMPIQAKMETLTKEDFIQILKVTDHNLLTQSVELLKIENVNIVFENEAIDEMCQIAVELNEEDNIGARRLRTVVDAVLEEINFEAPDFEHKNVSILISRDYVRERSKQLYKHRDFRQYTM